MPNPLQVKVVCRASVALGLLLWSLSAPAEVRLTVFAASSLTEVLSELLTPENLHAPSPRLVFAATSTLARQIEAGANAAVFISADNAWMDYLETRKLLVAGSRQPLLGNRLVLIMPRANARKIALGKNFPLAEVLGEGRLSVGDPAHVPAGIYAREALTNLGAWSFAETRLVPADSVRAALVLVERGEAAAGIVYETDAALSPRVAVAGEFPAESHSPIVYPVARIAEFDNPTAKALQQFLRSSPARAVFRRYGFETL